MGGERLEMCNVYKEGGREVGVFFMRNPVKYI